MNIIEAVKALKQGKTVLRKGYESIELKISNGKLHVISDDDEFDGELDLNEMFFDVKDIISDWDIVE